ncbi:MAG: aminoacyl-tRNA hydrolase [Patescibacteria group bacterium]
MFSFFSKSQENSVQAHEDTIYLVGLGNPGLKYEDTRHNVGFLFLDYIARKLDQTDWHDQKKLTATVTSVNAQNQQFMLVKPGTFMNKSGETVQKLLSFYKTTKNHVVVIHDDVDIPFGEYKVATNSGDAGHRGVGSIQRLLKTKEITRIRIGVGKSDTIPTDAYVLQSFSSDELHELNTIFAHVFADLPKVLHTILTKT